MKSIYLLIVLVIAVSALGCVDKNKAESSVPPAAIPSEVTQTPGPGEDIFGTYSDLAAMDNISSDLDMQIALSTDI
jgi:hypothetical protein